MSLYDGLVQRMSSWVNTVTGLGQDYGKQKYEFVPTAKLSDSELDRLYDEDSVVAAIVDVVPDEALRQGVCVKVKDDETATNAADEAIRGLNALNAFHDTWVWARLFGGALAVLGVNDGQTSDKPLDETRIRSIDFINVVEKQYAYIHTKYSDPTKKNYGEPETYRIVGITGGIAVVHESRVIRFDGVLTTTRGKLNNQGWSNSIIRRLLVDLKRYNGTFDALPALVQEAAIGVFKIKQLSAILASNQSEVFIKRMQLMDLVKSITHSIMVDADGEDYEKRDSGSLSGVANVSQQILLGLSQAARVPVTILMGQSPAGLTATGDSDVRWFYDRVASERQNKFVPKFSRFVKLLFLSKDGPTNGIEPETWEIKFESLWQPGPKEKAETEKIEAETQKIYFDMGVRTSQEIAEEKFGKVPTVQPVPVSTVTPEIVPTPPAEMAPTEQQTVPSTTTEEPPVDPEIASEAKDPALAYNGAQVTSLVDVVKSVANYEIPRNSGVVLSTVAFPIDKVTAEELFGEAGRGFKPGIPGGTPAEPTPTPNGQPPSQ